MEHTVTITYMKYDHGRQIGIAEKELRFDFPALVGTENQIAYANDLREKAIKKFCSDHRKIAYCEKSGERIEEKCISFYRNATFTKRINLMTSSAREIIDALA